MKAIMISIQPQWVEKILNGEKTIEIRKTKPNIKLPCKVYIYCTKGKPYLYRVNDDNKFELTNKLRFQDSSCFVKDYNAQNGRVVAEFTLNKVDDFLKWEYDYPALLRHLDLYSGTNGNYTFLNGYLKGQKKGSAWHIDNLKIYDTPKELNEFSSISKRMKGKESRFTSHLLQRPPQSWCYVEGLEDE